MSKSDIPPKLAGRLIGGLWRRARRAWRRLTLGNRPPPVEVAWQRLCRWGDEIAAAESPTDEAAYCELLAGCIETARSYGAREIADRWTERLSDMQQSEGRSHCEGVYQPVEEGSSGKGAWGRVARNEQRAPSTQRTGGSLRSTPGTCHLPGNSRMNLEKGASVETAWTTKHYLDAALLRVKAAFEDQWASFPTEIDPADGRMRAVRAWFDNLPHDARVADVGCGRGRFLKRLAGEFPEARLTGVDVSPAMLGELPPGIEPLEGSLLDIPAAEATFDGALAVESLEHSLLPERAVAELCRIVRAGGRVLIIDKHIAKQPLSEHDPWERWFSPEELTRWLQPWCDEVTVVPVSHAEGRVGNDLFLAASGRRRA